MTARNPGAVNPSDGAQAIQMPCSQMYGNIRYSLFVAYSLYSEYWGFGEKLMVYNTLVGLIFLLQAR